MIYWVTQKVPSTLVDGWELLMERFGSTPFSKRAAVDVLHEAYPELDRRGLSGVIDYYVEEGSLGVSPVEF